MILRFIPISQKISENRSKYISVMDRLTRTTRIMVHWETSESDISGSESQAGPMTRIIKLSRPRHQLPI